MPRVSVIVPAFTPELLYRCLRSIARFAPSGIPYETIVVLNQTTPGLEADLRENVAGLQVVSPTVNLGLAGGCNRGRSIARGEFLLVLHDDAEIEPGWMEALLEAADAYPQAGAIGSMVLFPDGRLQNAGMILWQDGKTSPPWFGEPPEPTVFDTVRAVDYCGTSSLLVRAAAWDAIGGLDERFYPAYYVDVDLAMSLRNLGLIVLCQPRSRIRHHRGASTTARFRRFVGHRNHLLFLEKWGDALTEYEVRSPGSRQAVERAVARAEAFAERCRPAGLTAIGPPAEPAALDPAAHELRHREMHRALQEAYISYLTDALEGAEKERDFWRKAAKAKRLWMTGKKRLRNLFVRSRDP